MAILEIAMDLPGGSGPAAFKAGGAVVRCDATEGGFRVAVFFTHMDEANRATLQRFIAERATTRPEPSA